MTGHAPKRIAFDMKRLMRTKYKIDSYQASYFVIESFDELFAATAPDFTQIYRDVRALPLVEAGAVLNGERTFN